MPSAVKNLGLVLIILKFWNNGELLDKLRDKILPQLGPLYRMLLTYMQVGQQKLIGAGYEPQVRQAQAYVARGRRAIDVLVNEQDATGSVSTTTIHALPREPEIRYEVKVVEKIVEKPVIVEKIVHVPSPAPESSTNDDQVLTIKENMLLIQKVLKFWFGQGTPDRARRQLWDWQALPQDRKLPLLERVTNEFSTLLNELVEFRWKEWCQNNDQNNAIIYGYQGKLAAIIMLDRLAPMMREYCSNDNSSVDLPPQPKCDSLSFTSCNLMVIQHSMEIRSGMVPIPMYAHALMPYRQNDDVKTANYVLEQLDAIDDFLTQCAGLTEVVRETARARYQQIVDNNNNSTNSSNKKPQEFTEEDLLGHFPFEADMTVAGEHPVFEAVKSFLQDRGLDTGASPTPIIVSLSGGVDSMVSAAVLAHAQHKLNYPITTHAVHVDYATRPESAAASKYLQEYCKDQLKIHFHNHRITDEERQGANNNDKALEKIRLQVYRDVSEHIRRESGDVGLVLGRVEVGIVLGHHRGDLRETVVQNASMGCGPLDLSGMTAVSEVEGVTLYRPLLTIEKEHIYEYAHAYGIAYLKEHTHNWSTRGKLRNKLLPMIENIFGIESMDHLSNLAVESDDCRSLLHNVTLGPFLDQVAHKPMGITFRTSLWADQGVFFWKYVLREALSSAKLEMFPEESVVEFLECIRADKIQEGWLQCREDYAVYLRSDGQVYVFKPDSYPWQSVGYQINGRQILYGKEHAAKIGPWRITAYMLGQLNAVLSSSEIRARLEKKAINSMDSFMEGKIDYYMEVPTWQAADGSFEARPLMFAPFEDSNRPKAWKTVDSRIQEILPLLTNDVIALNAIKDPIGWGTMHTDDSGKEQQNPVLLVQITLQLEQ